MALGHRILVDVCKGMKLGVPYKDEGAEVVYQRKTKLDYFLELYRRFQKSKNHIHRGRNAEMASHSGIFIYDLTEFINRKLK